MSPSPGAVVRLEAVSKTYRSGKEALAVLKNVDLRVERGEMVAIMGSSGSGKSTLLNILGILDRYDSGAYYLDGRLIRNLGEREAARFRNRFVGFVFQAFNLLAFKTALENVALPLYYRGVGRRARTRDALEYLERVGLSGRAHHRPAELSGGERQRVAVARALVTQPELLLADEPTGALDTQTSYELMDLFEELNAAGLTVLIVTHEHDIAERAHRIVRLRDGRIEHGDPTTTDEGHPPPNGGFPPC
ncbi:MAG: ABC transporter ATP-binding protein [Polyangiaceae bacterium]|nr:ABC transporter ATP-binding protein [Polyangiaceae bacterium]